MPHWKYCLTDRDFRWQSPFTFSQDLAFSDKTGRTWLTLSSNGLITIKQGYAWDGCTPKYKVFDWFYLGTPDGTIRDGTNKSQCYEASLIHDALYQFMDDPAMPLTRKEIDGCFCELMRSKGFSLRAIYYSAVRLLGGMYHKLKL